MPRKWFQSWFNSPYYHILYSKRNDEEAEFFINNLLGFLKPPTDSLLLDIACGRGRHSVYLNKKGFNVTGIDLSHANIKYAKQYENQHLQFYVHDMRYLMYINYFDLELNLFTSFGYFETKNEHINALKTFRKALKKDGILVLDYFNIHKILDNLVVNEVKRVKEIDFNLTKIVADGNIVKTISFTHKNKDYTFKEVVKAFSLTDFEELFKLSGFTISHYFGDYGLNKFDVDTSDRLIFICKKTDD